MGRTQAGIARLNVAADYAAQLLASLHTAPSRPLPTVSEHPALTAARSGLMCLTGHADGPPQLCPLPLAAGADGALAALASLLPEDRLAGLRGSQLLTERAALTGFARNGSVSPGGACRLLPAADGWIAVSLAREEDWALLPAWLETGVIADWATLAARIAQRPAAALVECGSLLGLAVAADEYDGETAVWSVVTAGRPFATAGSVPVPQRAPRVVDLSALWAGPLCGHLLQRCGAEVIKVESLQRPDGARQGSAAFFDLLNAGKRSVALDLSTAGGRAQLRGLLLQADIVIESSRPRALRQLGIDAEAILSQRSQLSWISLTGYGRGREQENQVAFGDDAAVAAGLSRLMYEASGEHLFVGDAIADPLTGIHAALAAWASWRSGGGRLIALALRDVVRHCIGFDLPAGTDLLRQRMQDWTAVLDASRAPAVLPAARAVTGSAAALGADTHAVLTQWAATC